MSTDLSIPSTLTSSIANDLERLQASAGFASKPHSTTTMPRPVHVVYGGAHLFSTQTLPKLGAHARAAMESWGADDAAFGKAIGVGDAALAAEIATRVREKLTKRPIEAMCIDFEDGYGPRSDEEEDAEAVRAANELAKTPSLHETASSSTSSSAALSKDDVQIGIRIKALEGRTFARAIRTLDLFVTAFARSTDNALRPGFSVTLPKVTCSEEVAALASLLQWLENALGIAPCTIGVELMIESPRALIDANGLVALPGLVRAGAGRVVAVHLGAYDLTAELGVTAGDQRLDHPYCDLARMLLSLSLSGSGIGISDGATTLLPIAPKKNDPDPLAATEAIHRAWSLHAENVKRAIDVGIWQGWDLHPAQLPARYGALFAHFLTRKISLADRLRSFLESAARASRVGQVFDDAATGQGLLSFFRRGHACGALDANDLARTTLTLAELEARSFMDIVQARTSAGGNSAP